MPIESKVGQLDLAVPAVAGSGRMVATMARLQGDVLKAMLRYQVETLGFLKHRCEQDIKLVDDLAGSEGLNDAFDICANFAQNALTDYSAESGKISGIGSRIAADTARRLRRQAQTTIEDLAAATLA